MSEHPEEWRPYDGEFKHTHGLEGGHYNLKFRLDPKYYDRFAGVEEGEDRIPRIHLTGWWKLRKIPNTMTEAAFDEKQRKWHGGEELAENDIGLKEKFWQPDTDDSQWPWALVPWDWNKVFAFEGTSKRNFGGVGWYRRSFRLDEVPRGHRVILHFEYVEKASTVWVNGKKIGTYTTYINLPGGNIGRGNAAEQHDYDITDAVKPNADNQLTVRVFHNGLWYYGNRGKNQTGGIWQPCWLDIVPPVHAETIHCTPNLSASALSLKCSLRNAFSKPADCVFRVVVKPWRSYRYSPPVDGVPVTTANLGARTIDADRSEATFEVKLNDPVTWDYEKPFLYHVQLYATVGGEEMLIGQARFGFREFKPDGSQFRLNGKRCFLPGAHVNEPYRGDMILAANYKDWCTYWYKSLRDANIIFTRFHSGHYPDSFYDTADEVGYLICAELLGKPYTYEDTPAFVACIKRHADDYYNHPSVITWSIGNEHLSFSSSRAHTLKWAPVCSKIYDIYKRFDKTRPITPCSGSGGVGQLKDEDFVKWPKSDYHDNHDYSAGGARHYVEIAKMLRHYMKLHAKLDIDGKTRPYINGECGYVPSVRRLDRHIFDAVRTQLSDMDREAYTKFMRTYNDPGTKTHNMVELEWGIDLMGLSSYALDPDGAFSDIYDEMLERYRLHGMEQVGFSLHSLDRNFTGCPESHSRWFSELRKDTARNILNRKLRPLYVACDGLKKHCFAGETLVFRVIAMNDTLHDLGAVSVTATIENRQYRPVAETVAISAFTQEKHHEFEMKINVPARTRTGHYPLQLTIMGSRNKLLAQNSYRLHILERGRSLKDAQTYTPLVYIGRKDQGAALLSVLNTLKVTYTRIKDFESLEQAGRLIIGPGAFDDFATREAYRIRDFVHRGGRLLVLRQDSYDPDPIAGALLFQRFNRSTTVDIVTLSHPAFRGLDRRDFRLWNGDVFPSDVVLSPLTPIVLAATTQVHRKLAEAGMAVGEAAIGEGVYMFSQLKAVENYERDSVAAHYVDNLIRYCVADPWMTQYAVKPPEGGYREKFKQPDPESCFFVDLRPYCNQSFVDDDPVVDNQKGGWVDDGPDGDMRVMPLGRQTFLGIPFDIIDPAKNDGRSCIILQGRHKTWFPERVGDIKVGRKAACMYFLISPTWTPGKVGTDIGRLVFHYEAGGAGAATGVSINLVVGQNIVDWTSLSNRLPEAAIAFTRKHPGRIEPVGALVIPWENPIPEERIESISFISSGKAVPALIAITGATKVKSNKQRE